MPSYRFLFTPRTEKDRLTNSLPAIRLTSSSATTCMVRNISTTAYRGQKRAPNLLVACQFIFHRQMFKFYNIGTQFLGCRICVFVLNRFTLLGCLLFTKLRIVFRREYSAHLLLLFAHLTWLRLDSDCLLHRIHIEGATQTIHK